MTQLELRFMEQVPAALSGINNKLDSRTVVNIRIMAQEE